MAEVFGVVSGAGGLISLALEIAKGVDILRDARRRLDEAPAELESLETELEFLHAVMDRVIRTAPPTDTPSMEIRHCEKSCDNVVRRLRKLREMLLETSRAEGPKKIIKTFGFRHWKGDIDALMNCIHGAKINLGL